MARNEQLMRMVQDVKQMLKNVVSGVGFENEDDDGGRYDFTNEHDRMRWYFGDLDVQFTIDHFLNYQGANVPVTLGAEIAIWYDTATGRIHGEWGRDQAEAWVDTQTCIAIDIFWEAHFDLLRLKESQ